MKTSAPLNFTACAREILETFLYSCRQQFISVLGTFIEKQVIAVQLNRTNINVKLNHSLCTQIYQNKSQIRILEFCTNSTREETRLFESFLITFMKHYGYRLGNIRHGSLYYHWKQHPKLISINFGFLLSFRLYHCFINTVTNPIQFTDVKDTPRKQMDIFMPSKNREDFFCSGFFNGLLIFN